MKRILAIMMVAVFSTLALPNGTAAETVNGEYFGTSGVFLVERGLGMSWRPCPGGCDLDDDAVNPGEEIPDVVKLSGGPLTATGSYSNVIVSVSDDLFGSGAGMSACFFHPEGDNVCQTGDGTLDGVEDFRTGVGCGASSLIGAPFAGNAVTVFVYSAVVTADFDVCGGTAGTLSADYF